ncbi:UDP-glucose 4-epimerase [subsurface metagenome]
MARAEKVLVTGGAGFIGSWLCDRLIEEGHEVVCIDNLGSGNKKNVEHLFSNSRFKFIKHDIREPLEIEEKIDHIFHLASRPSPADFEEYSIDILLTNAVGTCNMLELARKDDARFLLASSSEVYGDPKVHPQPEDYWGNVNPLGSRSVYDEGKRYAESLTAAYHRRYGLDVRTARIFNTYGPRMRPDDGRVISNFIVQALRGESITVYGDGSQTRSFCYVSDMVEGLKKLMFLDDLSGEVVNLGNPDEITILEVAELVKKLTGSNSKITFVPLPKDDPKRRNPDISKAKEMLGWTPKVGLEDGLLKTISYFKGAIK